MDLFEECQNAISSKYSYIISFVLGLFVFNLHLCKIGTSDYTSLIPLINHFSRMLSLIFVQISLSKAFIDFLLPIGLAGFATGIIDIATLAELGYISDLKYSSEYAKIYAVNEFSIWTGYAVGNLISILKY